jgi:DnaJ family protein A protein 5
MRCHYDVFEVERTATSEEIKKQYKRLALRYHPDRNHGNEAEAAEKFKEVSTAYSVLLDPQERKWYDDHRDAILRGGKGGAADDSSNAEDSVMNLWPFFNATCFSGFEDNSPKGYYKVYCEVFTNLESYERKCGDINMETIPPFGGAAMEHKEVLRFYNYWTNFASRMTFAWEDKYNPNEAPDRAVRRLVEKENKVLRDIARKEYNELVRSLANHCKKRDPRMEAILNEAKQKQVDNEQKRLNAKKDEKERKRQIRERNRQLEAEAGEGEEADKDAVKAFRLADNDEDDIDKYEFTGDDATDNNTNNGTRSTKSSTNAGDDDEEEEEEVVESYACEICDKYFKSAGQLSQHLNSKLHKTNEKMLLNKAAAAAKKKENNSSKSGKSSGKNSSKKAAAEEQEEEEENEEAVDEDDIVLEENNATEGATVAASPSATAEVDTNNEDDQDEVETVTSSQAAQEEAFGCELCSKYFKSSAQLAQHLSSKPHKTKEKEALKEKKKDTKKASSSGGSVSKVTKDVDSLSLS